MHIFKHRKESYFASFFILFITKYNRTSLTQGAYELTFTSTYQCVRDNFCFLTTNWLKRGQFTWIKTQFMFTVLELTRFYYSKPLLERRIVSFSYFRPSICHWQIIRLSTCLKCYLNMFLSILKSLRKRFTLVRMSKYNIEKRQICLVFERWLVYQPNYT